LQHLESLSLYRSFAFSLVPALVASVLLSGCGASSTQQLASSLSTSTPVATSVSAPAATPGPPFNGNVHGGQQPVVGSHIYLFAANPGGYGSPSISLFNPSAPNVFSDAVGAYVLTDASGNFQIADNTYSCSPGQQIYLLAEGGNPGQPAGVDNQSLALMSILGACPAGQTNFDGAVQYIFINEVSTVASVYALSGYMTDATHLASSGSPAALQGLANAFLTVNNLVNTNTGAAASQTPDGSGIVPQAEINTLANILVPCINSTGATPECSTLFASTPASGGILPTDAVTAALNIAHNPAANIASLFTQANGPYLPVLTAAPNDWTLAVTFYADAMSGPYFPAIDSVGNIWVPDYGNNTLTEFDPTGKLLTGNGINTGSLNLPYAIAIDAADGPWVTNFGPLNASTVSRFDLNGTPVAGAPYACSTTCFFPAFDAAQNLWISGSDRTTVLAPSGSIVHQFATSAYNSGIAIDSANTAWTIGQPRSLFHLSLPSTKATSPESVTAASGSELTPLAIDSADNVWYSSNANNAIGESGKSGVLLSPTGGYTGGGLSGPAQLAIDGANRVWVANRNGSTLSAFTNTGAAISPATGFQSPGLSNPRGLAIDGSGNVWLTNFTSNSITEFIGIATPVVTPISPATHGQRP
jgi:streptogramin lyase